MTPPNIVGALKARPTSSLVDLLRSLDTPGVTGVRQVIRNWIIEEIETRHDVAHAMDRWVTNDHTALTYVEALIGALPSGCVDLVAVAS